jgi:GTPase SAR1 family protein
MTDAKTNKIFKIILIGDVGTGKTSFITQLIHRVPERLPKQTTNLTVFTMRISKPEAVVQVWDSPGDSKYYYQTMGLM